MSPPGWMEIALKETLEYGLFCGLVPWLNIFLFCCHNACARRSAKRLIQEIQEFSYHWCVAVISSHLDLCNSFLGAYLSSICVSWVYKNSAARIVTKTCKFSSITPVFKESNWLPVKHRSAFKTATLVYRFLPSGLPKYTLILTISYTAVATTLDVVKILESS